jgi:hypothetical protein
MKVVTLAAIIVIARSFIRIMMIPDQIDHRFETSAVVTALNRLKLYHLQYHSELV